MSSETLIERTAVERLIERLRTPSEFNPKGPNYEPMIIPPSAINLEAATELERLRALEFFTALLAACAEWTAADKACAIAQRDRLQALVGRLSKPISEKAEAVLRAAAAFGDARAGHDALVRMWERGAGLDEMRASSDRAIAAGHELERASRAYATSIRKRAVRSGGGES